MTERVDVLVVGAGLSGIGAAYRLQTECPGQSYAILEARDAIGGTWDLFRYPGIRSDSDMFTLGYPFRPWRHRESIASGARILRYIRDTATAYGLDRMIRFGRRVTSAHWSSETATWTVRTATGEQWVAKFLYLCTGYYRYAAGHKVDFAGQDAYAGRIVHPQHWPADLDHTGARIVVIGSGATAVTLVPALARTAEHVTMLQRSPGYLINQPPRDRPVGGELGRLRAWLIRGRNILATALLYQAARRWPVRVAAHLRAGVARELPADVPVDPHFTPRYAPWDQRPCVVPDADLFRAIRTEKASVVTGTIETFTEKGIRLTDGTELYADVIVTATGLTMVTLGEIAVDVDGIAVRTGDRHIYKGMMLDGVPNLAWCLGYINASWTLRADLTSRYVCRLINYLDRRGIDSVTPTLPADLPPSTAPLLGLTSGYVQRAGAILPRQGARGPWRASTNYLTDFPAMRLGRVDDGHVRFAHAQSPVRTRT